MHSCRSIKLIDNNIINYNISIVGVAPFVENTNQKTRKTLTEHISTYKKLQNCLDYRYIFMLIFTIHILTEHHKHTFFYKISPFTQRKP